MKTDLSKGVRKITLTKSETNALRLAHSVCAELAVVAHPAAKEWAAEITTGLGVIIDHYCPDAAQSEPEAATTKAG